MDELRYLILSLFSSIARCVVSRAIRFAFISPLVFSVSFFLVAPTLAQQTTEQDVHADVRVVIDISGSMKQNDPHNLRKPALELLIKLLPDGSKAGVWTFGRYINMLVPHSDVDTEWRSLASSKVEDINSTGLYTNIGGALEKAAYDTESTSKNYRTSLILLTDGMVDISRDPADNQAEWRRIAEEVLPDIESADYTIHTVALSKNADIELMNKLALSTDGISAIAESADDLMKIFLEAFDSAAPTEQVPFDGNLFSVDSSIEEFTALIFRNSASENTRLISPDQEQYSADKESEYVRWHRAEHYDLITVERPIEGEWQVLADLDPDSRVTVVSNLNLIVKPIKNNFSIDEPGILSFLLREDGNIITRMDFLRLLDISYRVQRREDGKVWSGIFLDSSSIENSQVPARGIFEKSLNMFEAAGYYDITVLVDGKSFQREYSHTVSVRAPFGITLDKEIRDSTTHQLLTVSSYGKVDTEKTKVLASITEPDGRSSIKPLPLTEYGNWLLDLETNVEGRYDVVFRISSVDSQGGEFEFSPPAITLFYPDQDDPFASVAAEVSQEEEQIVLEPKEPIQELPVPEPAVVAEPERAELESAEPIVDQPVPESNEAEIEEEDASKLLLYIGLGLGNFVILALAFVAYRMIVGRKEESDIEELEKLVEDTEATPETKDEEPAPEPPSMADVDAATVEEGDTGSSELADSLAAEDLDISSDGDEDSSASTDTPVEEDVQPPPPMDIGEDEKEEKLGITDAEFSLDDFSSEELEDKD